jgi:hypothetical protein
MTADNAGAREAAYPAAVSPHASTARWY